MFRGRRLMGSVMIVIGTVGVVIGVGGALVGHRILTDLERDAAASLDLTADAVQAAAETIVLAGSAIGDIEEAVKTAGVAASSVSGTLDESEIVLGEVARITGEDLPATFEAIDDAMPGLVSAGAVIDRTLRALAFFGADYDPEQPFDDALRDMDRSLDGLPVRLEALAALLEESAGDLQAIGGTTEELGQNLTGLESRLQETSQLLAAYQATADEAAALVDGIESDLQRTAALGRVLVLVVGFFFAASQVVPLYLGVQLGRGLPVAEAAPPSQTEDE